MGLYRSSRFLFFIRFWSVCILCVIILVSCQVSAWNTPGTNEKSRSDPDGCDFRDRSLWDSTSRDCSFVINTEPGVIPGFEQELNTPYYNDGHLYLVENAIRIFRDKGYDNWAAYLSDQSNFQAIADGLTWADRYKDRLHVYVTLELCLIWCTDLHTWDVTDMVYAGFDHYYENYSEQNPAGEGLSTAGLQIWKQFLGMFASALVKGATGGILSVYGHSDPQILPIYPSAALLAEKRFDDAIFAAKNAGTDPNTGRNLLYWPDKSAQYNSLFQLGWALHLIQDIGVIYHMNGWDGSLLYSHNEFEDQADNKGREWQISGNDWKYGLSYDKSIPELAFEEAVLINTRPDWEAAKSDNEAVREPVVQKGIQISQQFTAAVLAKYLSAIGIPQKTVPFRGHVEDMKNAPVPGAYVFYRLKGEGDWKYVLTDAQGDFTLSGIDPGYRGPVIIRPVLPGYRYYGYDTGQSDEHLSLVRDTPLVYTFEAVQTAIPYYEFVMTRNTDNTGSSLVMAPELMAATPGKEGSIPELIRKSIFEVKKEDDRLVVSDQMEDPECGTAGGGCARIPKETYVEIQLSNLVDLTSGNILRTNSDIASKVALARVERVDFLSRFVASGQEQQPGKAFANLSGSPDTRLVLKGKKGLQTVKMMTPQFFSSDSFRVYPVDVDAEMKSSDVITDMRYTFGPDALSSSHSLFANDMARVPARNAEIEVTLIQSRGYIGPACTAVHMTRLAPVQAGSAYLSPNAYQISSLTGGQSGSTGEDMPYGFIQPVQTGSQARKSEDRLILRTDADGRAALLLRTGGQAGKIGLHCTVISNPDAPGVLPEQSIDFIVFPSAQHPDNPDVLPVLEEVDPRTYAFTGIAKISAIPKELTGWDRICGRINEDGTFSGGDCTRLKASVSEQTQIQGLSGMVLTPGVSPTPAELLMITDLATPGAYEPGYQQPETGLAVPLMNISGLPHESTPASEPWLGDTDLPGADYDSFELDEHDPFRCIDACSEDPACAACTYVKPGVQGEKARCWLKNAVPEIKPDSCCVSWIK